MKTNNQNSGNGNRPKEAVKQPSQGNQSQRNKNVSRPSKNDDSIYIKDMPEIDHAKPGIL